jgi:hypothetical protein
MQEKTQVQWKVQGLQELKEEVFIVRGHTAVNRVTETITEALKIQ